MNTESFDRITLLANDGHIVAATLPGPSKMSKQAGMRAGFAVTFNEPIHGLVCKEGHFPEIVNERDR